MNNINTVERAAYTPKKSSKWKNLGYGVMLLSLLNFSSPANAQNTSSNSTNTNNTETSTNSQRKYNIPSVYKKKLDIFLKNDLPIIKIDSISTWMFTAEFVLKEMESDRGIDKDNQLLFVWHSIYGQITGKDLYSGEDGDSKRLEEFRVSIPKIRSCSQRYKEGIMPFIEKKVAENKQRIANQDQQIAENKQQIAENTREIIRLDSIGVKNMVSFYEKHDKLTEDEKDKLADGFKQFMNDCRTRGIDYEKIILDEIKAKYPNLKEAEAKTRAKSVVDYWEGGYNMIF